MKIYLKYFLTIALFFTSLSTFANTVHGTLMVAKGDVSIETLKDKKLSKARVGSKIFEGDTIITGKDSRAKIIMVDKNVINISPDSKFKIEKYVYKPEQNQKGALLNVIYGKVRTTVNQKYDGENNKFQVKTKSSVAGVRGTDFLVQFNASTDTTKVVTFEGRVEVGAGLDASGRIQNSVMVDPGQFTVAAANSAPAAPIEIPKTELASLNEQSVAEAPAPKPASDSRQPSEERAPNSPAPNQGPTPGSGAMILDQMGEDVAAPVTGNFMPPPPLPQGPGNFCPPGGCGPSPITTIDPSLLQGKTNVIIQLSPTP